MEDKIIRASRGKVFRRISDGFIFGNEINLGYMHYINGQKLEEPILAQPEHFEEIDEPKIEIPKNFDNLFSPEFFDGGND